MPGANTHKYNCTFPAIISDWRLKFNQGSLGQTDNLFPFGFVQVTLPALCDQQGLSQQLGHRSVYDIYTQVKGVSKHSWWKYEASVKELTI